MFNSATTHPQIIDKADTIVSFLAKEGKLTEDKFDIILEATNDQYLIGAVYTVLSHMVIYLTTDNIEYIMQRFDAFDLRSLHSEMVEFIYSLHKYTPTFMLMIGIVIMIWMIVETNFGP